MEDQKYCVYLHRRKDNNAVFYVGEGTIRRPNASCIYTRSKAWHKVVEEAGGFICEILIKGLTKSQAQGMEEKLKTSYQDLVNSKSTGFPKSVTSNEIEKFRHVFYYCKESPSGLRWKINTRRNKAGSVAGSVVETNNKKYWRVQHLGRKYRVHRIVAGLVFGDIAECMVVDHIDGDGMNNTASNLRICTQSENMLGVNTRNSGSLGIKYHARSDSWVAYWQENGKQKFKYFSVQKHGESAKTLAEQYRAAKMKSNYLGTFALR